MGNSTGGGSGFGDLSKLSENLKKMETKKADTATAAEQAKQDAYNNIDTSTVSGRVAKAAGVSPTALQQDITRGAQFGEAVIGPEGLGRLGTDKTIQGMEAQAAELAKGYSSAEFQARGEKGLEAINAGTQAQSRSAQAALARSGVKGQAAGAQLGQIAQAGIQARGNLQRDLLIGNREAQMSGLAMQNQMVTSNRTFDIGQAAKEKDIALQAGLGFAQMGSAERGALQASQAQIAAAKAGKSSCFIEGTKIKMLDGSLKNIEDIDIADFILEGGVVYTISKSLISTIYKYNDIVVAGGHAVLEEGKWIRVSDSKTSIPMEGIFPVYNLSNENHRIVTECGTIFADYDETDYCSTITDAENLEVLNGKGSKVLETGRRV